VPDTWVGVIQGMWAFEGRSSLKTWIFRILIKSVGGINALHPRSPPRARRPLPSTPTSARWIPAGAVGTAHMTSLRTRRPPRRG
jgi:RNA polymerase sigma-70 factor, ECF subfamily